MEDWETYQLPDGRWCLIVDQFATHKGYLPLISSVATWLPVISRWHREGSYDLAKLKKRHGGIMQITEEELTRLKQELLNAFAGHIPETVFRCSFVRS